MTARRALSLLAALVGVVLAAVALSACGGTEPRRVETVVPRALNLFEDSDVKVGGLNVGTVAELEREGDAVRVRMELDPDVDVPADAAALVTAESLLGERYIQLEPIYTDGPTLADGDEIPMDRTGVPAEVDEVLSGLDDFVADLDAGGLGDLTAELAEVLDGQGADLGELLDGLVDASAVFADVDDTLLDALDSLADVAELVEARQEAIGPLLDDVSTVAATVRDEREPLIGAVVELRRLTEALDPLLADHADDLPEDIEQAATFLSTAQRSVDEVERYLDGSARLLTVSGIAFDYGSASLRVENQGEPIPEAITLRLRNRLVGLCLRLGVDECADTDYWDDELDDEQVCLPEITGCTEDQRPFDESLRDALQAVPDLDDDLADDLDADGNNDLDADGDGAADDDLDILDRARGLR